MYYQAYVPKAKKYFSYIFIAPFRFTFIRVYFAFALLINVLTWWLTNFVHAQVKGENIALHYSVDFGIDFYGPAEKIFTIPLLATFFLLLNFSITFLTRLYLRDSFRFIAHILLSATIIVSFILFGAVISVYLVNFR